MLEQRGHVAQVVGCIPGYSSLKNSFIIDKKTVYVVGTGQRQVKLMPDQPKKVNM